ncbi:hypothetical protein OG607_33220 [Streptomyces sp. NBC_01537]|uniref:hypothetical protein n=1 Tax=Streptomyces sp. NBC_01537 TaxID=2903896 RepID=UPI0038658389
MPLAVLSPLPKYRTDLVTRRLCATVHLDEPFARAVWEEFAGDGLQALGLPHGINLVALVRHARQAVGRCDRRDRTLAGIAWLLPVSLLLALWTLISGRTGVAEAAAGAAALLLVLAWGVAFEARLRGRQAALQLGRDGVPVLSLAREVDREIEERLESLKRANFVAYHASAESINPFVGSGWRLTEAVWPPIDVSRPAKDDQGKDEQIIPFDAADLHHYLAVEMPKIVGLETLKARNRLHVRGLHVAHLGPDVLPDRTRPPLAVVPKQLVQSGAVQTGAGVETYLCLRMLGPGGRVVVTMHLRALLLMPRLSWEVASYVLPPLSAQFDVVEYLPAGTARLWWDTLRTVNEGFRQTLFGAPRRLRKEAAHQRRKARDLARVRKEIRKNQRDWDYGAVNGLRELVADWDRMGYAEKRDTSHYFKRLEQGVLLATGRFLEEHNIDTSDFEDTEKQIHNTQTYNFNGPITGPVQAGGTNNQQMNQPTPPPAGQPRT